MSVSPSLSLDVLGMPRETFEEYVDASRAWKKNMWNVVASIHTLNILAATAIIGLAAGAGYHAYPFTGSWFADAESCAVAFGALTAIIVSFTMAVLAPSLAARPPRMDIISVGECYKYLGYYNSETHPLRRAIRTVRTQFPEAEFRIFWFRGWRSRNWPERIILQLTMRAPDIQHEETALVILEDKRVHFDAFAVLGESA